MSTSDVVRCRPHEIEVGDHFVGCDIPVARLLFTGGQWCYYGADGRLIVRKALGVTDVQVVRPQRRLGMVRL